ncbi:hypothetical protein BC938DRAFT_481797, partial [Jimgerdemannia flammicorona]
METLYHKAHHLQREVLQNSQITHIELLNKLEPYVAMSYSKVLDQELTLKGRFYTATDNLYRLNNGSAAITEILGLQDFDAYGLIGDHESRKNLRTGPLDALETFKVLRRMIQTENNVLVRRLEGEGMLKKRCNVATRTPEVEKKILEILFNDKTPFSSLEVVNSRYLTNEHFNTLAFQSRRHYLTSVNLHGAQAFNNSGFEVLFNSCGNFLEYLNLSSCPQLTLVANVKKISWTKSITSINVTPSQVFPADFPFLKCLVMNECANLQEVHLQAPLLERLGLSYCLVLKHLQLDTANLIEAILTGNSGLNTIDIALLLFQPSLQRIDLLGCDSVSPMPVFSGSFPLTWLHLGSNNIGEDGAKAVAKVIETNTTLTRLDMSSNLIWKEGAMAIAKALEINNTLIQLNLGSNNIGNEGAKAVAKALKSNKTLISLDLPSNNIGEEGAKAIAKAIETNKTLKYLDLSSNSIEKDTINAISHLISYRTKQSGIQRRKVISHAHSSNTFPPSHAKSASHR